MYRRPRRIPYQSLRFIGNQATTVELCHGSKTDLTMGHACHEHIWSSGNELSHSFSYMLEIIEWPSTAWCCGPKNYGKRRLFFSYPKRSPFSVTSVKYFFQSRKQSSTVTTDDDRRNMVSERMIATVTIWTRNDDVVRTEATTARVQR